MITAAILATERSSAAHYFAMKRLSGKLLRRIPFDW
jgi:hypothetical protein